MKTLKLWNDTKVFFEQNWFLAKDKCMLSINLGWCLFCLLLYKSFIKGKKTYFSVILSKNYKPLKNIYKFFSPQ